MALDLRARDALWGEDVTAVMRDAVEALGDAARRRGQAGPMVTMSLEEMERRFPLFCSDLRVIVALALNRART